MAAFLMRVCTAVTSDIVAVAHGWREQPQQRFVTAQFVFSVFDLIMSSIDLLLFYPAFHWLYALPPTVRCTFLTIFTRHSSEVPHVHALWQAVRPASSDVFTKGS